MSIGEKENLKKVSQGVNGDVGGVRKNCLIRVSIRRYIES